MGCIFLEKLSNVSNQTLSFLGMLHKFLEFCLAYRSCKLRRSLALLNVNTDFTKLNDSKQDISWKNSRRKYVWLQSFQSVLLPQSLVKMTFLRCKFSHV